MLRAFGAMRLGVLTAFAGAMIATSAHAAVAQTRALDSARVADSTRRAQAAVTQPRAAPPTLVPDMARTLDAEVRVAMFELDGGQELAALSRLERAATLVERDTSGAAAPERAALHFLLAQRYYRMGMLAAFRRAADASIAAGSTRYAAVLRPQLIVEAYRSGDDARATSLAREMPASEMGGLTALVAGLASYRSGDLPTARSAFQRAAASGGGVAPYAQYMEALTALRSDTTQAGAAVASLEAAARGATSEFADQVRLTAAQVAYEGERYADAARIAATVDTTGRLAAPALFTRAWALYKLEQVNDAERAFSDFAARYPDRPERDEARLMVAQAQLELGRAADAERVFQQVVDSTAAQVALLQAETNAALANVARGLVAGRAAGMLVVGDPVSAKALSMHDSLPPAAASAAITGTVTPAQISNAVTLAPTAVPRALDSVTAGAPNVVARVVFSPASATQRPKELAAGSESLVAADASVAVAQHRLAEELAAQQREIVLLERLAVQLDADSAAVASLATGSQAVADSMARLDQMMAGAEARLRDMLGREIDATRALAAENARTADSLRTVLAAGVAPADREALDTEVATAAAYTRIADMAATGLSNVIARHPTLVLRDSIRTRGLRARTVLGELQGSYGSSRRDLASALAALRSSDGPAVSAARRALSDAEARRGTVEGEVIAAVTAELSARAGELATALQRDTEAANFGLASATFFRAIDGTRAVGDAGGATGNGTATAAAGGSSSHNAARPRSAMPERRR